jgi:hypothetical protein
VPSLSISLQKCSANFSKKAGEVISLRMAEISNLPSYAAFRSIEFANLSTPNSGIILNEY